MKHIDAVVLVRMLAGAALLSIAVPIASSQTTATSAGPHSPRAHQRLPQPGEFNVLVIVLDDLGTDQLALYADDPGPPAYCASTQLTSVRTPRMDELRADGLLFTRCYVNPTCSPTRAAILTGRYGRRTGVGHAINPGDTPGHPLPTSEVTLPKLLSALNPTYRRGAFGKWHMTHYVGDDCHPADSGFEVFEGVMGNPGSHYDWRKVSATGDVSGCTGNSDQDVPAVEGLAPAEYFWDAGVTRTDAVDWINSLGASPFLAYVAFSPPHAPWEVPPFSTLSALTIARLGFLGYDAGDVARDGQPGHARVIYRTMIEGIDYEIGALLDGIAPDVLARTMVFIVGDNGTPGEMLENAALSNHGKRTLFELGTRAPLLAWGPLVGAGAMGGASRNLVGAVDLWRTIANVTGITNASIDGYMGATLVDSETFLASLQTPASPGTRTFAYAEAFANGLPLTTTGYQRAMSDGVYRYIRKIDDAGVTSEALYDVPADPCETTDLMLPPHVLTSAETNALNALRTAMDAL